MTEQELRKAVRTLRKKKRVGEQSHEGKFLSVPCYTFQGMNAGWWENYMIRYPENDQCRIICTELQIMDKELEREFVKTLPSEAVRRARVPDHDLGHVPAKYAGPGEDLRKQGGSNGNGSG